MVKSKGLELKFLANTPLAVIKETLKPYGFLTEDDLAIRIIANLMKYGYKIVKM